MKRAITALSLLCGGLLFINPITNIIFAQNTSNKPTTELVENMDISTNKEMIVKNEENTDNENIANEVKIDKVYSEEIAKENIVKSEINSVVESKINNEIEKDENNKQEVIAKEQVENTNTVEVIEVLNQEQAKELLEMYNKGVNYTFQGDQNAFEALVQKGLSGYVFFPDYDTDLGFFVDKNTASIYYFHPSGYLELVM
jgi:membrane-associated HD superfamily phosphohydrolase